MNNKKVTVCVCVWGGGGGQGGGGWVEGCETSKKPRPDRVENVLCYPDNKGFSWHTKNGEKYL